MKGNTSQVKLSTVKKSCRSRPRRLPVPASRLAAAIGAALLLLQCSCGREEPVEEPSPPGNRFLVFGGPGSLLYEPASFWCSEVSKRTGIPFSLVVLQTHTPEEIRAALEKLGSGSYQGALIPDGILKEIEPGARIFSSPFLFPNRRTATEALSGEAHERLSAILGGSGFRPLSVFPSYFEQLVNNARPIYGPADVGSLNVGIVSGAAVRDFYRELGARVQTVPSGSLRAEIHGGRIDGTNISLSGLRSTKIDGEVQYLTRWNAFCQLLLFCMNESFWSAQPDARRATFLRVAEEAAEKYGEKIRAAEEKVVGEMRDRGAYVYDPPLRAILGWREGIPGTPGGALPEAWQELKKTLLARTRLAAQPPFLRLLDDPSAVRLAGAVGGEGGGGEAHISRRSMYGFNRRCIEEPMPSAWERAALVPSPDPKLSFGFTVEPSSYHWLSKPVTFSVSVVDSASSEKTLLFEELFYPQRFEMEFVSGGRTVARFAASHKFEEYRDGVSGPAAPLSIRFRPLGFIPPGDGSTVTITYGDGKSYTFILPLVSSDLELFASRWGGRLFRDAVLTVPVREAVSRAAGEGTPLMVGDIISVELKKASRWFNPATKNVGDWRDREVDLAAFTGKEIRLLFEAVSSQGGEPVTAVWSEPVLYALVPPAERRNIVLVCADTLRADSLHCYGFPTRVTPNIDRLAQEGVLCEDAFALSSWTKPSHATIFTSVFPSQTGVARVMNNPPGLKRDVMDARIPTLAELLSPAGYFAVGFTEGGFVEPVWGFGRGFDFYQVPAEGSHELLPTFDFRDQFFQDFAQGTIYPSLAHQTFGFGMDWLEKNSASKEFFLFLHTYETHSPYHANPFTDTFKVNYDGPFREGATERRLRALAPEELADWRLREHLGALYASEVNYLDVWIGKLMEKLEELRLADNTLLVFLSDHGEYLLEEHRAYPIGHGTGLYPELTRIPLVLRSPLSLPPRTVLRERVSTLDVLPTCLQIAGVETPPGVRGRSLLRVLYNQLREKSAPTKLVLDHLNRPRRSVCILDGKWAYLYYLSSSLQGDKEELYDMVDDPRWTKNLAAAHPAVCQGLREEVLSYLKENDEGTYLVLSSPGSKSAFSGSLTVKDGRFRVAAVEGADNREDLQRRPGWLKCGAQKIDFECELEGDDGIIVIETIPENSPVTVESFRVNGVERPDLLRLGGAEKRPQAIPFSFSPGDIKMEVLPGSAGVGGHLFRWAVLDKEELAASDEGEEELDQATIERLRALGYVQ